MSMTWSCKVLFGWVLLLIKVEEHASIMSIRGDDVYSLFPHEDLLTGKKLYQPEDRARSGYQNVHQHKPDLFLRPHYADQLVPILYPRFRSPSRGTTQNLGSYHDSREKNSQEINNYLGDFHSYYRRPRVYFRDDLRRIYGYGTKYHKESPPILDDRSRESNLIRPSPVDYSRDNNRERIPSNFQFHRTKLSRAPYDGGKDAQSRENFRIHVFTDKADRYHPSGIPNYSYPRADGPAKIDSTGPASFLNHEEYLRFHTKLALETLERERNKLEKASKFLTTPSSTDSSDTLQHVKTNLRDDTYITGAVSTVNPTSTLGAQPGSSENQNSTLNPVIPTNSAENRVPIVEGVGTATISSTTSKRNSSSSQSNGSRNDTLESQMENGFLPVAPFHIEESFQFQSEDNGNPATEISNLPYSTEAPRSQLITNTTTSFLSGLFNADAGNHGILMLPHVPGADIDHGAEIERDASTSKVMLMSTAPDIPGFLHDKVIHHVSSTHKSHVDYDKIRRRIYGGMTARPAGEGENERVLTSPTVYLHDGQGRLYTINVTSSNSHVIYVQRVQSSNGYRRQIHHNKDSSSLPINLTDSVIKLAASGTSEHNMTGQVEKGAVTEVHAHTSSCPKLHAPVEILCDVTIRERDSDQNPHLIVGWIRKFHNESNPNNVVAVGTELAYEEDFHDKFNVTLSARVSPTLRSVLMINNVSYSDCGTYECEVFDGLSVHRSETLVFLCL